MSGNQAKRSPNLRACSSRAKTSKLSAANSTQQKESTGDHGSTNVDKTHHSDKSSKGRESLATRASEFTRGNKAKPQQ